MESTFLVLSNISVKDKIERKGNLDYLSWANAWALLKLNYPDAQRIVYECPHTGFNYFTDGRFAWVKVGIVVNGVEHIDYLPVMDYRNNSIPMEKMTAMDVNKTIQRSTAKAIAMHGLGLSLWTGEDIPEMTAPAQPQVQTIIELNIGDENWGKVLGYVAANKQLGIETIVSNLEKKYKLKATVKKEIQKTIDGYNTTTKK